MCDILCRQLHDDHTRRLWFMWPPTESNSPSLAHRCGCVGNCNFFGDNRNGSVFFKPKSSDLNEGLCCAIYHLCEDNNFGYMQSLLDKTQLVLPSHPESIFLSTATQTLIKKMAVKREKAKRKADLVHQPEEVHVEEVKLDESSISSNGDDEFIAAVAGGGNGKHGKVSEEVEETIGEYMKRLTSDQHKLSPAGTPSTRPKSLGIKRK